MAPWPVNRAKKALYEAAETNTQGAILEKWAVVLVFKGVEMVRLEGQNSPSRAVSWLQKGGKLAHILWPIWPNLYAKQTFSK